MINVSEEFKEQLNKTVRNETFIRIVFGISDPDAPWSSDITDNGHLYYLQEQSIDLGYNVSKTYETLESNRFVLNGNNLLAPTSGNFNYQGYISDVMSNDIGEFEQQPILTIDFGSQFFKFAGTTMTFDNTMNNYPTEFDIIAYYNDVEVHRYTHTPTRYQYVSPVQIPECNKMVFVFKKTNVPHRRIRVHDIIYGIVVTLLDEDVIQCNLTVSTDVISSDLPINEFNFTIFDINDDYNPDNPNNLIQYLESGQSVKFYIGQMLDDETLEWIPMYTGYTSGEVSISDGGVAKNISIGTKSLLNSLDVIYHGGVYSPSGQSMYSLALDLVNYAGYSNSLDLPTSMNDILSKNLINGKSVKEGLQLVANACGMALVVTRDGIIKFVDMATPKDNVFQFTDETMINYPKINRIPQLRTLGTSYFTQELGDVTKIADVNIDNSTPTEYNITFGESANITYTSSGLSIVGTPILTSTAMVVTCSGTGTISISGRQISYAENKISTKINELGVDTEMSNPLIDSELVARRYMDYIIAYYDRRTDYTFDNRGYPHIDIGDTVSNYSNYGGMKDGTLYYNSIKYNGAISGNSKTLEF